MYRLLPLSLSRMREVKKSIGRHTPRGTGRVAKSEHGDHGTTDEIERSKMDSQRHQAVSGPTLEEEVLQTQLTREAGDLDIAMGSTSSFSVCIL